jgi:hypothetical protein
MCSFSFKYWAISNFEGFLSFSPPKPSTESHSPSNYGTLFHVYWGGGVAGGREDEEERYNSFPFSHVEQKGRKKKRKILPSSDILSTRLLKYFFPPTERPPKKKLMASVHKQTIPTR